MFKLVLEKAEELEIKLPKSAGSWIKQEFQKNVYFCFIDYAKAFDCVDHNITVENSERDGNTRPPDLPLEKSVCRSRSNTMEQQMGSKLAKEYVKAVYCHPAYLTYMQEYIMWNAGLDEAQAGIKIARRNINNLRYADDTTFMKWKGKWRGTKEPLDESERGEWKSWLKAQHLEN